MSDFQQRCRSVFSSCNSQSSSVWRLCSLSWVTGSLREQHSKVTAMRSSACVVMATKAVAALLRNKMAGVVLLSLLLALLTPPSLPLLFLFGISELERIGPPVRAPSCSLTLLLILSLQPSIHTPHMWVSRSLQRAGVATLDMIKVMFFLPFAGSSVVVHTVWAVNQLVESTDERKTQISAFTMIPMCCGSVKSLALVRWDTKRVRMVG